MFLFYTIYFFKEIFSEEQLYENYLFIFIFLSFNYISKKCLEKIFLLLAFLHIFSLAESSGFVKHEVYKNTDIADKFKANFI